MKTAVSIPDELFESADRLANRLGVSRSALYAAAVAEFIARHRSGDVTKRLNAVHESQPSTIDPKLRRAQARTIRDDLW